MAPGFAEDGDLCRGSPSRSPWGASAVSGVFVALPRGLEGFGVCRAWHFRSAREQPQAPTCAGGTGYGHVPLCVLVKCLTCQKIQILLSNFCPVSGDVE